MTERRLSRRRAVRNLAVCTASLAAGCATFSKTPLRLATFRADVTVPIGHGMMGGAWLSSRIADPLEACGIVLFGSSAPIVLVSVDWCEIRNDAYAAWQSTLARAIGTDPRRVLVSTVHQHDAPVADLEAERILRAHGCRGTVCDLAFHEQAVQTVAEAMRKSLRQARPVTHLGMGQSRVERIASNRRYQTLDGQIRFDRTSSTRNPAAVAAEEGLIDPWLKTLSFWNQDEPLAALSFYAVHPMSYYGAGEVSADFPGLARRARAARTPGALQVYFSGCSGNVTAGKYNTGAKENRIALANRLEEGMERAWNSTARFPLDRIAIRSVPVLFEPRESLGFTISELKKKLVTDPNPFQQCLAAMGLSWRHRLANMEPIHIAAVDFGRAMILLLPGEAYVEFQLAAQKLRPDRFVCVAGYGDGATGYIPPERHIREGDTNLHDWCWVAPGAEEKLLRAMDEVCARRGL